MRRLTRPVIHLLVAALAGLLAADLLAAPAWAQEPGPVVVTHGAFVAGGPTPVTLQWHPVQDSAGYDDPSYTVRYRNWVPGTPVPDWTVAETVAGRWPVASLDVRLPVAGRACWQVRGESEADSAWSAEECFGVDVQAPLVTRTSLETWMPVKRERRNGSTILWWTPPFSYGGADDSVITGWQVQEKFAFRTLGEVPPIPMRSPYLRTDGWTTDVSLRASVEEGGVDCFSVRARDAVGRVSAWSAWRCTYGPLKPEEWLYRGSVGGRSWMAVQLSTGNPTERAAVSYGLYCATGLRIKVRTGPRAGRARLFVGAKAVGTFSGRSKHVGWKWVVVRSASASCGRLRFKALTRAQTQIGGAYALY